MDLNREVEGGGEVVGGGEDENKDLRRCKCGRPPDKSWPEVASSVMI